MRTDPFPAYGRGDPPETMGPCARSTLKETYLARRGECGISVMSKVACFHAKILDIRSLRRGMTSESVMYRNSLLLFCHVMRTDTM